MLLLSSITFELHFYDPILWNEFSAIFEQITKLVVFKTSREEDRTECNMLKLKTRIKHLLKGFWTRAGSILQFLTKFYIHIL